MGMKQRPWAFVTVAKKAARRIKMIIGYIIISSDNRHENAPERF